MPILDNLDLISNKLQTIAANMLKVYIAGYESNTGIIPNMTNYQYFSYNNNHNNLVEKLKFNDTSNATNFSYMLCYCDSITSVPLFDTSKGTKFISMFRDCSNLLSIPEFDFSNSINSSYMFQGCKSLESIDLSNTNLMACGFMFQGCSKLKTILNIDMSNATSIQYIFDLCISLQNITFKGVIKLNGLDMTYSSISHDSIMSAINSLYDYSSDTTSTIYTLKLGTTNLNKLTDEEKDIATEKGWALA